MTNSSMHDADRQRCQPPTPGVPLRVTKTFNELSRLKALSDAGMGNMRSGTAKIVVQNEHVKGDQTSNVKVCDVTHDQHRVFLAMQNVVDINNHVEEMKEKISRIEQQLLFES